MLGIIAVISVLANMASSRHTRRIGFGVGTASWACRMHFPNESMHLDEIAGTALAEALFLVCYADRRQWSGFGDVRQHRRAAFARVSSVPARDRSDPAVCRRGQAAVPRVVGKTLPSGQAALPGGDVLSSPALQELPVRCCAATSVSIIESGIIALISVEVGPAPHGLSCELAAGHNGSHVRFVGTAQDGQWWWLQWGGRLRELIETDPCDVERSDGGYWDSCLLPYGHSGAHSFELGPR